MFTKALTNYTKRVYSNIHRRTVVSSLKSIDEIPGNFDLIQQEQLQPWIDPVTFWNDKYKIAKQHDPQSPMIKFNAFGVPAIVLLSHDLVKQWQGYELRGQTQRIAAPHWVKLIGSWLVDTYGHKHSEWRKKAMSSFKPNSIDEYTPFIQQSASNILGNVANVLQQKSAESIYFQSLAKQFAFEVGIKFVYGPLLNHEERKELFEIFQVYTHGFNPDAMNDLEAKDPKSSLSKAYKAQDELVVFLKKKYLECDELIKNNQWAQMYGDQSCLLQHMIANDGIFDNDGEYGLDEKVKMTIGLTFAAYDTSATSLTNLIYTMWKHPKETEIVRDAIMNDPKLSDPKTSFTMQILNNCQELEWFINDSQRMYGLAPFFSRIVRDENGLDFGGYKLPKGTGITIPIKWLHHGERSWTESMEFKPSRFDKSNGQTKEERGDIGRYNNIPFATGLHKCLGIHLALLEMKIYCVLFLRDYEFEIDESKLEDETEAVNHMNLSQGFPHFNVYLQMLKKRE